MKNDENIQVCIRVRPLRKHEIQRGDYEAFNSLTKLNLISLVDLEGKSLPGNNNVFQYDHVYGKESSNLMIYQNSAKSIITSVFKGINASILAYGQTSSGKSHTMLGYNEMDAGIIPLTIKEIFNYMENHIERDFLIRVSYVEIYNEHINDLLIKRKKNDDANINMNNQTDTGLDGPSLKIREDHLKGAYLECNEIVVTDANHVLQLLQEGEKRRTTGSTSMNDRSSRSHSIFKIVIESKLKQNMIKDTDQDDFGSVLVASLNLVDLAGSESVRYTCAEGIRQREAGNINKSLLTLSRVIKSLSSSHSTNVQAAPFRDSKLTRLLQNSIAGNARTMIICCITPSDKHLEESKSTLRFAAEAKRIKSVATVNEIIDDKIVIKRCQREILLLKKKIKYYKRNFRKFIRSDSTYLGQVESSYANGYKRKLEQWTQKLDEKKKRKQTLQDLLKIVKNSSTQENIKINDMNNNHISNGNHGLDCNQSFKNSNELEHENLLLKEELKVLREKFEIEMKKKQELIQENDSLGKLKDENINLKKDLTTQKNMISSFQHDWNNAKSQLLIIKNNNLMLNEELETKNLRCINNELLIADLNKNISYLKKGLADSDELKNKLVIQNQMLHENEALVSKYQNDNKTLLEKINKLENNVNDMGVQLDIRANDVIEKTNYLEKLMDENLVLKDKLAVNKHVCDKIQNDQYNIKNEFLIIKNNNLMLNEELETKNFRSIKNKKLITNLNKNINQLKENRIDTNDLENKIKLLLEKLHEKENLASKYHSDNKNLLEKMCKLENNIKDMVIQLNIKDKEIVERNNDLNKLKDESLILKNEITINREFSLEIERNYNNVKIDYNNLKYDYNLLNNKLLIIENNCLMLNEELETKTLKCVSNKLLITALNRSVTQFILNIQNNNMMLKEDLEAQNSRYKIKEQHIIDLNKNLSNLKKKMINIDDQENNITFLNERLHESENSLSKYHDDTKSLLDKMDKLENNISNLTQELSLKNNDMIETKANLDKLKDENKILKNELIVNKDVILNIQYDYKNMNNNYNNMKQDFNYVKNEYLIITNTNLMLNEELETKNKKCVNNELLIKDMNKSISYLKKHIRDNDELKKKIDLLTHQLQENESIISKYYHDNENLLERTYKLEDNISDLTNELTMKNAGMLERNHDLDNLKDENDKLTSEYLIIKNNIMMLNEDLETKNNMCKSKELLIMDLNKNMEYLKDNMVNNDELKNKIAYLSKKLNENEKFISKYHNDNKTLLDKTYKLKNNINNLTNELNIKGNEINERNMNIDILKNENYILKKELATYKNKIVNIQNNYNDVKNRFLMIKNNNSMLNEELLGRKLRSVERNVLIDSMNENLQIKQNRINKLDKVKITHGFLDQVLGLKKTCTKLNEEIKKLNVLNNESSEIIAKQKKRIEKLEKVKMTQEFGEKFLEYRNKCIKYKDEIKNLKDEIFKINNESNVPPVDQTSQISQTSSITQTTENINELKSLLNIKDQQIRSQNYRLEEYDKVNVNELLSKNEIYENEVNALKKECLDLHMEVNDLQEKLSCVLSQTKKETDPITKTMVNRCNNRSNPSNMPTNNTSLKESLVKTIYNVNDSENEDENDNDNDINNDNYNNKNKDGEKDYKSKNKGSDKDSAKKKHKKLSNSVLKRKENFSSSELKEKKTKINNNNVNIISDKECSDTEYPPECKHQ